MATGREILIYFAIIHKGDRRKILESLTNKEKIDEKDLSDALSKMKSKALTCIDPDYPEYLKREMLCPLVLFYYGDISLIKDINKNIAVIGSRNASTYGLNATKELVKGVANRYNVVSGMALGIDACAQTTAIENGGKTIAVLGSGIDYIYPKTNTHLYINIKEKGLILSEYPNNEPPCKDYFPFRNRIISYLSKGILITEAKPNSGTLITVSWGDMTYKELMCVPYPIGQESGCNRLIKNGSYLVETVEDVLYIMDDSHNQKNM